MFKRPHKIIKIRKHRNDRGSVGFRNLLLHELDELTVEPFHLAVELSADRNRRNRGVDDLRGKVILDIGIEFFGKTAGQEYRYPFLSQFEPMLIQPAAEIRVDYTHTYR